MTLIMSVVLLLITKSIQNAKTHMIRGEVSLAIDTAIRSCFAEYNERLFKEFHLMYIDTSYKGSDAHNDKFINHFKMYLGAGLAGEVSGILSGIQVQDVEIRDVKKLSDEGYDYLMNQIYEYEGSDNGIVEEEEVFIKYLVDCFGYSNNPRDEAIRVGEIEYLIYGSASDYINIDTANNDYKQCVEEMCKEDFEDPDNINYELIDYERVLPYEEYLTKRLTDISQDLLLVRFLTLVEEDMKSNGSPGFDVNECIYGANIFATIINNDGYEYIISRRYAY